MNSKKDILEVIFEPEYKRLVRDTIFFTVTNLTYHDVEECISDVYDIAVDKRAELEAHPNTRGWLIETTKIVAMRFKSKRKLVNATRLDITEGMLSPIRFEEAFDDREQFLETLAKLKKGLKVSEYRLFEMKYLEGLTNGKIAEIIGKSEHAVDSRISRLKKEIARILDLRL